MRTDKIVIKVEVNGLTVNMFEREVIAPAMSQAIIESLKEAANLKWEEKYGSGYCIKRRLYVR